MISVVLCCYNGEKYIKQQLESIYNQSQKVDEVLIYDDGSSDNTINICKTFIKDNNLNGWNLIINKKNCGVYLNFIKGCTEAQGDIIFLADQDDIWHYNKVEVMAKCFNANNKILSLATGFKRIDSKGNILSEKVKHPYRKNNGLRKIKLGEFLKFYNYLGMTMAIRKSFLKNFLYNIGYGEKQRKEKYLTHDIALNFYAVLLNGMFFLDKELVTRRTHLESTSNINNHNFKLNIIEKDKVLEPFIINIKMYVVVMEWLLALLDNKFNKEKKIITKYYQFYDKRYQILIKKDIKGLIKLIKNINYYKTPLHYINDYLYIIKSTK